MRSIRTVGPFCVLFATSVYALRSILFHPGIPAYVHDWAWPFTASQLRDAVYYNTSVWNPAGMGAPNIYLLNHPVFWVWHYLALAIAPSAVLKLTLLVSFFAVGTGVASCARQHLGVSAVSATAGGVAAVLAPALYTELVAGHLYDIMALAALLWALALLRAGEQDLGRALGAGTIAALAALQVQVLMIAIAMLAAVTALDIGRRRTWPLFTNGAVILIAAVLLLTPQLWSIIEQRPEGILATLRTITHWELNNSSPFAAAPLGLGYFAGYAERGFAALPEGRLAQSVLWAVPAIAGIGLIVRWRQPFAWVTAALSTICVLLVAGLNGPLAYPLSVSFKQWIEASAFRELYHFAGPAWSLMCILASAGIEWFSTALRPGAIIVLIASPFLLWLAPNYANQLRNWQEPDGLAAALQTVAKVPGSGRVLYEPAEMPVGPPAARGGYNPAAYAIGDHATGNAYRPMDALEVALGLRERRDPRAAQWSGALGISVAIVESGIGSKLKTAVEAPKSWPSFMRDGPAYPSGESAKETVTRVSDTPMAFATTALQIVNDPMQWSRGAGFVMASALLPSVADDPNRVPQGAILSPTTSYDGTDPSRGWATARIWQWLDPRIAAAGDGIITWSRLPLDVPLAPGAVRLVRILCIRCAVATETGRHLNIKEGGLGWAVVPGNATTLRTTDGLTVITGFVRVDRYQPVALPSFISDTITWPLDYRSADRPLMTELPQAARWVVLKEAFSPHWTLALRDGRILKHVPVDGYANGWLVALDRPTQVGFIYDLQPAGSLIVRLSLSLWLLCALLALGLNARRIAPLRGRAVRRASA